ncbi:MAG: type I DNA topoisomerase [Christensenellaceae bacterium]|nr:type I DNA topoisomerase [Christensenellaceae bacterium]
MANKKNLVIVESPAKAKTITKFLGKNYKVIASQGHLRDLPKSQLGIDTQNDFEMKYITIRGKGDIMALIKKEAKAAEKVLLATDPDREGEAISWHIANVLNIDSNSKCRIEFNEITKNAIKDAVKKPRPVDMNRVDSQQARRALDRLVGYGISPILWAKIKKGLSAGRVQSVATRLVVERDNEINAFVPEEYWEVLTTLSPQSNKKATMPGKIVTIDGKKPKLENEKQATLVAKKIEAAKLSVDDIKQSDKKRTPLAPFTTSTLQQDAGRKLNFSTAKTMQIAQQLYEGISLGRKGNVGLVTYIRTDSVRISNDALESVRGYILNNYGKEFLPSKANVYKGRSNAQDAHEAIRPTYIENTPNSIKEHLTRDQFKLYNLIYNRFLASQMNPAIYETNTILVSGDGVQLRCYEEHKVFDGYTVIYNDNDEQKEPKVVLPKLNIGEKVLVLDVKKEQFFTQPPAHFTEASLVKQLEDMGIGRPSTYAPTISTIIARGYVTREKKNLYATELGIMVNDIMLQYFNGVVDYDFTKSLENDLDLVEEGNLKWKTILRNFYPKFSKELEIAEKEIEKIEIKDVESDIICDQCGRTMVYKMSKYGEFLACPGFPECRNTKTIVDYIDVDCPDCGSKLVKKRSKKNRVFYGCENYPNCEFVSWDKPTNEKCPVCGSYMVEKPAKKDARTLLCSNEKCRHKIEKQLEENDD